MDEWKSIQPREKTFMEKRGLRTYHVLSPYEWSNVIQSHFFLHTRLPCCLKFKKANVSLYGLVFLSIRGRCCVCGSIFDGSVEGIPALDSRLVYDKLNYI